MMRHVCCLGLLLCACRGEARDAEQASNSATQSPEVDVANAPPVRTTPPASKALIPVRLPGVMEPAPWLADATRVVAYNSGEDAVIVASGTGWLRWFDATGKMLGERLGEGGAQVLEVADLNHDGSSEILFARGRARGAADAPAVLEVLHLGAKPRSESIALPPSSRGQVVAVVPVQGLLNELWVASFVNKFEVEINRFARSQSGTWAVAESRGRHRVVADMVVLPDGTPVVARMYGDTSDSDGGVYALTQSAVVTIPSTRGARALLAMPGDDPGLVMADGWHKHYGKRARGLLTIAKASEEGWSREMSLEVAKSYGFSRLRSGHVYGDSDLEVIAAGNGNAVVMVPSRPNQLFELAGSSALDAFPVDLRGDARMEVLIAGPKPAIWSAR